MRSSSLRTSAATLALLFALICSAGASIISLPSTGTYQVTGNLAAQENIFFVIGGGLSNVPTFDTSYLGQMHTFVSSDVLVKIQGGLGSADLNFHYDNCTLSTCHHPANVSSWYIPVSDAYRTFDVNGSDHIFDPGGNGVIGNYYLSVLFPEGANLVQISAVPEPSTWAMLLLGFVGISFVSYKRSRKNSTRYSA
jgi:hypothetical protein